MLKQPLDRPSVRPALVLGFGLTLGLWLFTGIQFTGRMAEVEQEAAAVNTGYMRAQDLLSDVRAQVLLASVYVRDALLDPSPLASDGYRRQLDETYASIDAALQGYEPFLDASAERDRLQRLRGEIDEFRRAMSDVLSRDVEPATAESGLLLSRRVATKREDVVRVSEDVQSLNRQAFVQQQTDVAEIYRATQRRLWQQLGVALVASLAIGLLATVHAGRLENRLKQERQKDLQNAQDLQRLSAKLIAAEEQERRTIARELHDEVGQLLQAIKVELALAQRDIDAAGGHGPLLDSAKAITDDALHSVRDLSHLLHPALLDDLGLPAAIDWYLRGFGRRHGVRVELVHDQMEDRLSADTETSAFRIVQEALTNVARHARATSCRVALQRQQDTLLMTIEDDGVGFDPAAPRADGPRGLGLIGIRERVSQLRGTTSLESAPGRGTRLTVALPARVRVRAGDAEQDPQSTAVPLDVAAGEVAGG